MAAVAYIASLSPHISFWLFNSSLSRGCIRLINTALELFYDCEEMQMGSREKPRCPCQFCLLSISCLPICLSLFIMFLFLSIFFFQALPQHDNGLSLLLSLQFPLPHPSYVSISSGLRARNVTLALRDRAILIGGHHSLSFSLPLFVSFLSFYLFG